VETEYHEEGEGAKAESPEDEGAELRELIDASFARYDPVALGAAVAVVLGVGLFLATAVLLLQNGDGPVGPNLSLLGAYFLGYTVSWTGAILGLVEASFFGFLFGWVLAQLINALVAREQRVLTKRIEGACAMQMIEGRRP